jgi:hypothetical protein
VTVQPQTDRDGSVPEVILDRFQVMTSVVGQSYYVSDLTLSDMVVRGTDGLILRFNSVDEAKKFIFSFASHENAATTSSSKPAKWRTKMAKTVATARATKELAEARKAAKAADAQLDGKDTKMVPAKAAKKITALRASAGPKVVPMTPKGGRPAKAATTAKAAGSELPKVLEGEGSGAYIRRLLKAGFVDTAAILKAVHAQFEGSKAKASDVSWNKGKLKKDEGWVPPAKPAAAA